MTRFAANLSILFPPLPFLSRFDAAAAAGFDAVEFWWPADAFREGVSADDIVGRARDLGLQVVLINFDAGDMKAGERGLAADPARREEFRANVPPAIDLACRLGCRKLNALAGNALEGLDRATQLALVADNVAFAADEAARYGISIMLEALNPTETQRYLLPGTDAVLAMIDRLGRPNVRFQLDSYHLAMAGEDVVEAIARAGDRIGHVQLADMSGCLPFGAILDSLAKAGYRDPVALEFVPTDPAAPDFRFIADLGGRLAPRSIGGSTQRMPNE
jgi:hydroxypyruvate isomerase